ncbi:MAG TPA: L,D-transpeptidase [Afifellaceae bacterium]|nr:L,D-transpeptidase [Afifellaceae bacterium]
MSVLLVSLALLATVGGPASAEGAATFFDVATKKWVTYGRSARPSDVSPIKREVVAFDGPYGPNTIIVSTSERRLYYTLGDGKAIKYGVGVGREGFQWAGTHRVTRKAEWPNWTPPPAMIKRRPELAAYAGGMPGGPQNPLGARALYIGSTLYRIHGTNEAWSIGQAVSSGCIRMANEDVVDLYDRVKVGTRVVVSH